MMASIPPEVWGAAAGSGFNAILVLILLIYGRSDLKRLEAALDRNSRSINNFIMAISVEHQVFTKQAESISKEIDAAEARRNAAPFSRGQ
jgi:hypothetical protein